jgi:hypothetical protein
MCGLDTVGMIPSDLLETASTPVDSTGLDGLIQLQKCPQAGVVVSISTTKFAAKLPTKFPPDPWKKGCLLVMTIAHSKTGISWFLNENG